MQPGLRPCRAAPRASLAAALAVALAFAGLVLTGAAAAEDGASGAAIGCDRERGERVFTKCAICHAKDAAQPSPVGPHLQSVIGRQAATLPQFKYSKAMREFRQTWTSELLDRFLSDPMGVVPGTVMAFTGLRDAGDRAAVICLLQVSK